MNGINPLIPMGAITGVLSERRISEILKSYADVGIRQFLVYPRDGCDVPYMSERWLEICGCIIKTAKALGMDIWLYDEFNWPSGTCYGRVMSENPEYRAHRVVVSDGVCRVESYDGYADVLNPDAVDCFIRKTHDVYYARFGEYFGTTIKGIFTDEPSVYYFASGTDGFPYTKGIEKLYSEKTGRDFFEDVKHPDEVFSQAFYSIITSLFREKYVDRLESWCKAHGIVLTGHLLSESNISSSNVSSGDTIHVLRGFGLPGMDEIYTFTSVRSAELLTLGSVQAAVRAVGNGGLAELFALGPTDLPPARVRQMIWLTAMFGIDRYLLAVSACDARGNVKKNGWFNPMNYMQPWFEGYPELGKDAEKAARYAGKTIVPEVYVRYPIKATRKYRFNEEKSGLVNKYLRELLMALTVHQYQWQLIDDEPAPAEGVTVELDDLSDFDIERILETLGGSYPDKPGVLDEDGALPDDILLRRYTDGSAVILDLRDGGEPRRLYYHDGERTIPFTLESRDYCIPSESVPTGYVKALGLSPEFSLSLGSENTLRPNIRGDKTDFEFTVSDSLNGITLSVRDYMYDGKVFLDGNEITASNECTSLVPGIRELYRASDKLSLSPGKHTVSVSCPAKSEPFLPSVFISGAFASDANDRLYRLPDKVGTGRLDADVLPQYAGKITYETELSVPDEKGLMLKLGTCGLYTRVYLCDTCLGGKLHGFVFEIPDEFIGKTVSLRIEQFTSVGPIFGRAADVVKEGDGERWTDIRKHFPQKYMGCGITSVEFVK